MTQFFGSVHDHADRHFSHNIHSVRVLDQIFPLNLTLQTLTGIGGHNGEIELDESGKVQADTFLQLNGTRLTIPEVVGILATGKTADYGVHMLDEGTSSGIPHFWRPYNEDAQWVSYCTAALSHGGNVIGVLVLSSPIQDMMQRLFALQNRMILYFLIAAAAAFLLCHRPAEIPPCCLEREEDFLHHHTCKQRRFPLQAD